jgi:hypothetical protein
MSPHDVLNFFEPYGDLPAHHENQLTRAFLVVLRISPAAHQAWLSLVAPNHKLYKLPQERRYDTQRRRIFDSTPDGDEPIEGISVLQAADAQAVEGPIQITDRGQVLDGIVQYGDKLVIVIETKLDGSVDTRQAQELNVHGARVRFDRPVHVSWRDLLESWSDLVAREIVAGAERAVLVDFLDFVDRNFPHLGPFTTLRRCEGHPFRVTRRLHAVLGQIADGPPADPLDLPGRATVKHTYLDYVESSKHIRLTLYPADTLTQARAFYARPGAPDALLALRERGWGVEANFHFGYMPRGYSWTTADAKLEQYVAYWCERIKTTVAVPRERWEEFWAELVHRQFARTDEKRQFDQEFTNTIRQSAAPRPGLMCSYLWPLSEAERLDDPDRNQLVDAVAKQLNVVLHALGEKPFPP